MCQSADCQQFGVDKENWDWNNNAAVSSPVCQCSAQLRRTRRRHPATIQTPGRLEVGEVFLEPLVSNRLEDSPGLEREGVKSNWNLNYSKQQQQQQTSYLFTTQPVQSLNTKQRFDVLGENFRSSSSGGGGGWNQNLMSSKLT